MLGVSGVPALIQLFSMLFFPESPRWLMKMEKKEKADEVFGLIFKVNTSEGKKEMEYEIAQIQEAMEIEDVHVSQYTKYKELFTVYRKIVFIGVMLQVWQQLSGINTMMYYGPDVMLNAGFGSKDNQLSVNNKKNYILK